MRRRRITPAVVGLIVIVALGFVVKEYRYHFVPKRFDVVEPDRIYRSGLLKPGPLKTVVEQHDIRTILTLLSEEPDDPDQQAEQELAASKGIELIRIPMPGDGCAEFDKLEQAAAVLEQHRDGAMLVHCAAGVQRTGAVIGAWRMRYHGWSLQQAIDDLTAHGHDVGENELIEHLTHFHAERIAPVDASADPAP